MRRRDDARDRPATTACGGRHLIAALAAGSTSSGASGRRPRRPLAARRRADGARPVGPRARAATRRFAPRRARERIAAAGLTAVCRCDDGYPERLRELADPPAVIHVAGDVAALQPVETVAIVGARRGTRIRARGLALARPRPGGRRRPRRVRHGDGRRLGRPHRRAGGSGRGARRRPRRRRRRRYPASRRRLHAELIRRGCVVSELPPASPRSAGASSPATG